MSLRVNEIFYSIQGESSYAGYPCVFVRLSGCNLRCTYCDTDYAYFKGMDMPISQIIEDIRSYNCLLVEITGGEPLIQEETPILIKRLLDLKFQVLLETNGSHRIDVIDNRCIKILDIKCPSSGEHRQNNFDNLWLLNIFDEIKCVIGDKIDYEYAKQVIKDNNIADKNIVHFSPVFGKITAQKLAKWILKDHLNVKLQLQLHKIIWRPDKKSV